jgi:hypothetical protein
MAKRTTKSAAEAEVETYKHEEAKRKNIPTAENQKLVADEAIRSCAGRGIPILIRNSYGEERTSSLTT